MRTVRVRFTNLQEKLYVSVKSPSLRTSQRTVDLYCDISVTNCSVYLIGDKSKNGDTATNIGIHEYTWFLLW